MTPAEDSALARALRETAPFAQGASLRDWELVVREAREAKVLGTLAVRMRHSQVDHLVPDPARGHLVAGERLAVAQNQILRREMRSIERALENVRAKVVLLKGAAYLAADLSCAGGRLANDVDILVPRDALAQVEAALMLAGYSTTHTHPYDQRYYRRWMHELPPMQHVKRGTIVDVHHTIVPPTSRVRLNASRLFEHASSIADGGRFFMLAPTDMVLHSATHLFNNEDMTSAFRDLVDLDALLRQFGDGVAGFWDALPARADELDLWRPLYYALRFAPRILATPLPESLLAASARRTPSWLTSRLMNSLLERALAPSETIPGTRWARQALYVRGHWLKMPVPLLAWHLTVKSLRREERPA